MCQTTSQAVHIAQRHFYVLFLHHCTTSIPQMALLSIAVLYAEMTSCHAVTVNILHPVRCDALHYQGGDIAAINQLLKTTSGNICDGQQITALHWAALVPLYDTQSIPPPVALATLCASNVCSMAMKQWWVC